MKMTDNENITYTKYKVRYTTKAGEVKTYEYVHKYTKKGKGLNINKKIFANYSDIINDETLNATDKAGRIYNLLDDEDRNQTDINKLRSFIYRCMRGLKL